MMNKLQNAVFNELFSVNPHASFQYAEWVIGQSLTKPTPVPEPVEVPDDGISRFPVTFRFIDHDGHIDERDWLLCVSTINTGACLRAAQITEVTQRVHRGTTLGTPMVTKANGRLVEDPNMTVNRFLFEGNESERPARNRVRGTNEVDPLNFTNEVFQN